MCFFFNNLTKGTEEKFNFIKSNREFSLIKSDSSHYIENITSNIDSYGIVYFYGMLFPSRNTAWIAIRLNAIYKSTDKENRQKKYDVHFLRTKLSKLEIENIIQLGSTDIPEHFFFTRHSKICFGGVESTCYLFSSDGKTLNLYILNIILDKQRKISSYKIFHKIINESDYLK